MPDPEASPQPPAPVDAASSGPASSGPASSGPASSGPASSGAGGGGAPSPEPRRRVLPELAWVLAFVPLAIAATWPLVAHFGTHLAGDRGDNWQSLWNLVWIDRSLWHGENPFSTPLLWHPHGVTLVFQTFDLPDMVWAAPVSRVIGPVAAFNLVVLWIFVASGASMYAFARACGASRPASFLAGCAFTFSTYHFAHARGHLHILAMQWAPLVLLALVRALDRGSLRWAAAGGVFFLLNALASWYHAMTVLVLMAFVAGARLLARRHAPDAAPLRRGAAALSVLALTATLLTAPFALAVLRERGREPVGGAHPAAVFSADLESFVFPNSAQALAAASGRWRAWTGNAAENGTYLGLVLLALVAAGAVLGAPRARLWLAAAVAGVVLSLGPALHVAGRTVTGEILPYAWLTRLLPVLEFTGVPVRLGFVATFALAAALAPSLDALARRLPRARAFVWLAGALALVEHVPHRFILSDFPVPAPLRAWAADPSDFAVLDATRDSRHLWHAALHGHPIMGGYVTRTPERLERALHTDPVAAPLVAWEAPPRRGPLSAARLWFDFAQPVAPGAEANDFSFELEGTVLLPAAGRWEFFSESDDDSRVWVDGRLVVDNAGEHPMRLRSGVRELSAGPHRLRVSYRQRGGGAGLVVSLAGPGTPRRVVGPDDAPGGFSGTGAWRVRATSLSRDAALARLRELRIRYVVQDAGDSSYLLREQLGLSPAYEGEGVRIWEVPPGPR